MERKNQKKKKNEENKKLSKAVSSEATYFRLCHFCFHLNEADQPIMDCTVCANLLSSEPIEEFYEDVYELADKAPTRPEEEDEQASPGVLPNQQLRGLSVIW